MITTFTQVGCGIIGGCSESTQNYQSITINDSHFSNPITVSGRKHVMCDEGPITMIQFKFSSGEYDTYVDYNGDYYDPEIAANLTNYNPDHSYVFSLDCTPHLNNEANCTATMDDTVANSNFNFNFTIELE